MSTNSFKILHRNLDELSFLPGLDELMWFSDAIVPRDLLCSDVVVAISDLSGAQVHVICAKYT